MDSWDRDWDDFDDPAQRALDGPAAETAAPRRIPRPALRIGLVGAVIAAGATAWLAFGTFGVGHSIAAGIRSAVSRNDVKTTAPSVAHGQTTKIPGSSSLPYGSTYTLTGRTGGTGGLRATGAVTLRGRWNRGTWIILARTRTDAAGRFKIHVVLERRGRLDLRLLTPDGSVGVKTLHVS